MTGLIIGNNAEKLMPVLAQSPGPLQLLPHHPVFAVYWQRMLIMRELAPYSREPVLQKDLFTTGTKNRRRISLLSIRIIRSFLYNSSAQLLFTAVANEKTADFRHPNLDLTLSNHALPPPTYSDAELVEIWDRITRSFRLRDHAF